MGYTGTDYLDGKLNAVHAFNRMLGWKEIDAIRSGTWTKQEDYVGLDVSQVQAQIEYDTFQAQRIYQVAAQVEVDDVVSYTSQLLAQIEYEETPNIYTSQLIVQVEYSPGCNFTASIGAGFSSNSDADILSERLLVGAVASSVSTSEPDLNVPERTSYLNNGGSGYREPLIIVTSDTPWYPVGNFVELINGSISTGTYFNSTDAVANKYIRFEFPASVSIDEVKWYQNTADTHGSWKWQGSDNGSSWSDIGSSFTLGGSTTQTQTQLNGNTASYRYYQLVGVSGNFNTTPHIQEIEFKINIVTESYLDPIFGAGDRTSTITASITGLTYTNAVSGLINGTYPTSGSLYFSWNQAVANATIKFDFGVGNSPIINEAIWVQNAFYNQGTWKWQGSNNNSDWTDIGASFPLGGDPEIQIQTELNGNTAGYRYYRLFGLSGSCSDATYVQEILFNIVVAGANPEGSIVWGQITGVVETIYSFASSWTGTGEVVNTGDGEEIELEDGEYMECSPVNTGTQQIEIIKDGY